MTVVAARRLAAWLVALGCAALPVPVTAATTAKPPAKWASIRVRVEGFRNTQGHARLALFRGPEGFPDDPSRFVRASRIPIRGDAVEVVWSGLEPGSYAVSYIHDENDDGVMNKSFLGLPLEGGGFSRNAAGTFGPPAYEEAQLELQAGVRLRTVLTIVYY
jgi:uncharacterized protein (DUF2141 family)